VTTKQHQAQWQRIAAGLALFAILMIVFAPLVSVSLQKDPMSAMPGMHHDMSMMADHHHAPSESIPVDHAEACGYWVLLATTCRTPLAFLPLALSRYPRATATVCLIHLKIRTPRCTDNFLP